jgi:hypothetical protein
MTRNEIREDLFALPYNEKRVVAGVDVVRRRTGWSVDGGQPVSVKVAATLIDSLRRIRA